MKTDNFISYQDKRYVRMASQDVEIWQHHNDAVSAASKNIRERVV